MLHIFELLLSFIWEIKPDFTKAEIDGDKIEDCEAQFRHLEIPNDMHIKVLLCLLKYKGLAYSQIDRDQYSDPFDSGNLSKP